MTRICAIGNSHLAALMLGWKAIADEFPDVEISFFAAGRSLLRDLAVSQGKLIPASNALRRAFAATNSRPRIGGRYDAYLLCGLLFGLASALQPLRSFRADSHARDDRIPISDRCFEQALRGLLRETLALEIVAKLRQITRAPIVLVREPLPALGGEGVLSLSRIEANRDDGTVARQFDDASLAVADEANVRLVSQPEATKATPLRTNPDYARGSVILSGTLDAAHHEGESRHMNERYGSVMLRLVLEPQVGKSGEREGVSMSPADRRATGHRLEALS